MYQTDSTKHIHCKQWPIYGMSSAASSECSCLMMAKAETCSTQPTTNNQQPTTNNQRQDHLKQLQMEDESEQQEQVKQLQIQSNTKLQRQNKQLDKTINQQAKKKDKDCCLFQFFQVSASYS
jgi:hypothetical protein